MTDPDTIFGVKVATLVSSAVAAVISVALEFRHYDVLTALGSVVAGVFVATVATDATLHFLNIADHGGHMGYAVAAGYGITGRNLMIWLRQAASNPPAIIRALIGKGGRK